MLVPMLALAVGCKKEDTDADFARYMFATSEVFDGDFGGIEAADAMCQSAAAAIEGDVDQPYLAWVSESAINAIDRMNDYVGPWIRTDGAVAFADKEGLAGSPLVPLLFNENGTQNANDCVWTGTMFGGTASRDTCHGFRENYEEIYGLAGVASNTSKAWTEFGTQQCNTRCRLYCFQQ